MKLMTLAAAALALAAGRSSASETALLSAAGLLKVGEGYSGVSAAKRAAVSPADSWPTIKRKADPAFPTVLFPDGQRYTVDQLCHSGDDLKVVGKAGARCLQESAELGACVKGAPVELVTPRDYTVRGCAESRRVNRGGSDRSEHAAWDSVCAPAEAAARHELRHEIPVFTRPVIQAESGETLVKPVLLFRKPFEIPACR